MIYPVNVCIKRFYRVYVEATSEEVVSEAHRKILDEQDACLVEDPDIDIELEDICSVDVDYDGAMFEED